jgi:hypothetical protein
MKVQVILRRKAGIFVPRFGPQYQYTGDLITARKSVHDREVSYLSMRLDHHPSDPRWQTVPPLLFEARITDVCDNEIRFMGWEVVDLGWHVQEWDCFVLR